MRKELVILLFSLAPFLCHAQDLSRMVYGLEDGLPTMEIYGTYSMYDKLYVSSGEDIVCYDGYTFDVVTTDSSNHVGYAHSSNRLSQGYIIRGGERTLVYYNGEEWFTLEGNVPTLHSKYYAIGSSFYKIDSSLETFVFSEESKTFIQDSFFQNSFRFDQETLFNGAFLLSDSIIAIYEDERLGQSERFFYLSNVLDSTSWLTNIKVSGRPFSRNGEIYFSSPEGSLEKVTPNGLESIDLRNVAHFGVMKILSLIRRHGRDPFLLLVSFQNEGDRNALISVSGNQVNLVGFIGKSGIINPYVDPLDNVWVQSHDGLIRTNPHITFFDGNHDEMVSALHTLVQDGDGVIWLGGYGSGLTTYKNGILERVNSQPFNIRKYMPGGKTLRDGSVLFAVEEVPRYLHKKDGKWHRLSLYVDEELSINAGYFIDTLKDGTIAIGMQKSGLGIVEKMTESSIHVRSIGKEKGVDLGNVIHFAEGREDRIWMGRSSRGVAVYDVKQDTAWTYLRDNKNPFSFGAMALAYDAQGTLWLGTNRGLYCLPNAYSFDPRNEDLFKRVIAVPLPDGSNSLVTFLKIVKGHLIIGNQTAVSFLDLQHYYEKDEDPWIYQLRYGQDIHGEGSEQNAILYDSEGFLWVGSQGGASRINLETLIFDTSKPKIQLKSFETGKGELSIEANTLKIPIDSRNLTISFGPDHNPNLMKNTFFHYYLVNERADTFQYREFDQEGILSLNYIPPGNYKLNITAKKHGQIIDQKSIKIVVPLSLIENPLTWLFLSGLSILLLSGFFIFRARQNKRISDQNLRLAQLKNEKDSLQIQAIVSSFNPHLINNSLHWAQSKYKEDLQFTTMIGGLADNIEYIFNNTKDGKAWHTLQGEIKLVKNYVNIQLLRFNNGFRFEEPDSVLLTLLGNQPILIMQIQIHIENAIEHGLSNRLESSFVRLELENMKDDIKIIITDDGIGRPKARLLGSRGTQQGTKMLKDLHGIYNSIPSNSVPITCDYKDNIYIDKNGEGYGTRVSIVMPKNYVYEL